MYFFLFALLLYSIPFVGDGKKGSTWREELKTKNRKSRRKGTFQNMNGKKKKSFFFKKKRAFLLTRFWKR